MGHIYQGCNQFEKDKVEYAKVKRNLEALHSTLILQHVCSLCGNMALSRAGLQSLLRSHQARAIERSRQSIHVLSCTFCHKVCKSSSGLIRYMKIHVDAITVGLGNPPFRGNSGAKARKSKAGLRSHLRSYDR